MKTPIEISYRYFKMTEVKGGEWPETQPLQVGSIVRVLASDKPWNYPAFNESTNEWVYPVWTEVANPRHAAVDEANPA